MQRTTIYKNKKERFFSIIVKNNGLLLIFTFLIIGLLIGAISDKIGLSFNAESFNNYLNLRQNKSFFYIFLNSFLSILPFYAVSFFAGTCMAGTFISPAILLYRGYLLGSLIGYLYLNHGIIGILFNVLLIIPTAVISSIALILSSREAFLFSLALSKLVFPGKVIEKNLFEDFKLYTKRQLIWSLLFLLSCLVDALFSISFLRFFNF